MSASQAWVDGTEATLAQAREVLRRELIRTDRTVIILTNGVTQPCSLMLSGPIARKIFDTTAEFELHDSGGGH